MRFIAVQDAVVADREHANICAARQPDERAEIGFADKPHVAICVDVAIALERRARMRGRAIALSTECNRVDRWNASGARRARAAAIDADFVAILHAR